ncbi:DUF4280 domain-containing protein [Pendulispora albinea]|uniref:DUF4280 domain-containing protein n=1 Tax=Pendulispora albinea TaxID=2741071 RepID=A0ABZ2MCK7_9BACT
MRSSLGVVGDASMATSQDALPLINLPSFGTCSATALACVPAPPPPPAPPWSKTSDVFEIDGFPVLTEASKCACQLGGTIQSASAEQSVVEIASPGGGGTEKAGPWHDEASANEKNEKARELARVRDSETETFSYELRLHDDHHDPCGSTPYRLELESGQTLRGTTDGSGLIQQRLPKRRQTIRIVYAPGRPSGANETERVREITVIPETTSGDDYIAHLRNFGFDEADEQRTLLSFQAAHPELVLSGALDEKTRAAIRAMLDGQMKLPKRG